MNKKTKFDIVRPLIDEAFASGKTFTLTPNGVSMLPFIKGGKSAVTIEKYTGDAKKYDIIFYQRKDGQYVMHRVLYTSFKGVSDEYGVAGDNQWWVETVNDKDIFARVTSVNGKKSMGSFFYLRTLFIRRFLIHVRAYIKRHFFKGERK